MIDFTWTVTGGDDVRHIGRRTNLSEEIEPIVLTKPPIQNCWIFSSTAWSYSCPVGFIAASPDLANRSVAELHKPVNSRGGAVSFTIGRIPVRRPRSSETALVRSVVRY